MVSRIYIYDIASVNSWLLYRPQCVQLQVLKKNYLPLHRFFSIATTLLLKEKDPERLPGRPTKRSLSPVPTVGRNPIASKPNAGVEMMFMHTGQKYVMNEVAVEDVI